MRSTDEQLRIVRDKASKLRRRRQNLTRAGASAACLSLLAALIILTPRANGTVIREDAAFGSLILTSPVLTYVVIAILAFVLGVCVTLLCILRRPRRGRSEEEES